MQGIGILVPAPHTDTGRVLSFSYTHTRARARRKEGDNNNNNNNTPRGRKLRARERELRDGLLDARTAGLEVPGEALRAGLQSLLALTHALGDALSARNTRVQVARVVGDVGSALNRNVRVDLFDARAAGLEVPGEALRAGLQSLLALGNALVHTLRALKSRLEIARFVFDDDRIRRIAVERDFRKDLLDTRAAGLVVPGEALDASRGSVLALRDALGHGLSALHAHDQTALVVEGERGGKDGKGRGGRRGGVARERELGVQLFDAGAAGLKVPPQAGHAFLEARLAFRDAPGDGLSTFDF